MDIFSPYPIAPSIEDETTACQKKCQPQQNALVACLDSIRASRLNDNGGGGQELANTSVSSKASHGNKATSAASTATACLPITVAAWTSCCEDANLRDSPET